MKISTVLIGRELNKNACEWGISTDDYGNSYLKNEAINQKIRIGKNVEPYLGEVDTVMEIHNQSVYASTANTFVSNNYKNNHLALLNYHPKDKKASVDKYEDDNLFFLVINNRSYKLIDYVFEDEIVQTFHKTRWLPAKNSHGKEKRVKDFQGACIRYKNTDHDVYLGYIVVCSSYVKRGTEPKFEKISFTFCPDGSIHTATDIVTEKTFTDGYRLDYYKKSWKKNVRFVTMYKENTLVTNTYIVCPGFEDVVHKFITDPNFDVIVSTPDTLLNNPEVKEKIDDRRIRAVTFIGYDEIPQGFYYQHKILYAYSLEMTNIDDDTFWIECIKSN